MNEGFPSMDLHEKCSDFFIIRYINSMVEGKDLPRKEGHLFHP